MATCRCRKRSNDLIHGGWWWYDNAVCLVITKATSTHSQYVILIAFPRHQWLRERASLWRSYVSYLSRVFSLTPTHSFNSVCWIVVICLWYVWVMCSVLNCLFARSP
jgi:hypothetical protein